MEERIRARTREEESIEAPGQIKPKLPPAKRQQRIHSGGKATFSLAFIPIIDKKSQIPTIVSAGVEQTADTSSLCVEVAKRPAGISNDRMIFRPVGEQLNAIFPKLASQAAHEFQMIVSRRTDWRTTAEAGESGIRSAKRRGVIFKEIVFHMSRVIDRPTAIC